MNKLICLDCNSQAGDVVYHHKCADSAGLGARCGYCFNVNREEANFKMQYEKYGIATPQMIQEEFCHTEAIAAAAATLRRISAARDIREEDLRIQAAAILYMFSTQAYTRSYLPK